VRTRSAVIDALLALYEEGDLNPTAVRVAGRAGVALRTVYGHFADLESLYAEASERELARTLERVTTVPRLVAWRMQESTGWGSRLRGSPACY
jgi:AcrR family transcriptional regulator